jgi:hypothetical protein
MCWIIAIFAHTLVISQQELFLNEILTPTHPARNFTAEIRGRFRCGQV